jgi:hypothetical protein
MDTLSRMGSACTVYINLRSGQVAGYSENGNEISGFIKCGEFSDQLKYYWLVNENSVPWRYVSVGPFKFHVLHR